MYILIVLFLVSVTILVLGYPLVNPSHARRIEGGTPENALGDLERAREAALDALRDLQFEYSTGKLSQNDYEMLRARYELRAMQILQQMDALLSSRRKSGGDAKTCPRCHSPADATSRYCVTCGSQL